MINLFLRLLPALRFALAVGMLCAMLPAVALAQRGGPPPVEPRNDGVGYLLVLFCVALSVIILCRGSNRSPEVRLKDMEEE